MVTLLQQSFLMMMLRALLACLDVIYCQLSPIAGNFNLFRTSRQARIIIPRRCSKLRSTRNLRRELNEEQLSTATNNERISSNSQLLSFPTIIKRLQDLTLPKMATTSSSKQMEVNPRGIPRAPFVVSQEFKAQGSYLELLADMCICRTMSMSTWVVRMLKSKLPSRSSRKPPRMWFCKSDLTTFH